MRHVCQGRRLNRHGELVAGRFELYDQIGRGGAGSVWRAYDRKHGEFVAAKLLTHTDAAMVLRFVREQSLRVHHPNVVAPSGWAADDDRVVLRMDLVRGGSVATLMGDHGPLPENYVAVLLDQVLDALSAVHAVGVVHRDVKPANLLLDVTGTDRPRLRLSDFGIAAVVDEPRLTHAASSLGTLGYMSPEQAAGAEAEPPQDLYAVGVLGRVLLSGSPPRLLPDKGGSRLWSWLQRLSSPTSADRPASAALAIAELRTLGVPAGAPWAASDDPPEVFDQLGPDPVRATPTPDAFRTASPAPPESPGPPESPAPPPVSRVLVPSPLSGLSDPRSDQPTVRRTTTGPPDRGVGPESRRRALRVVAIVCFVGMVALLVAAVVVLVR